MNSCIYQEGGRSKGRSGEYLGEEKLVNIRKRWRTKRKAAEELNLTVGEVVKTSKKKKKLTSCPLSIKPRAPGNLKEMRKMLDVFIILQRES